MIDSENSIRKLNVASSNVMTGGENHSRFLYYQLKMSMAQAKQIDLIVSFLMESGVEMILDDLKRAIDRNVKIRILTGNYLGITQPSALYMIRRELGDQVDLRFYNDKSRSFHPKSYIFHYDKYSEIYIGSSNISRSALTSGIEWNFRFTSDQDQSDYEKFYHTFEELFNNHSIVIDNVVLQHYSKNWHRPALYKDLDRYDSQNDIIADPSTEQSNAVKMFRPRGPQIEALYALEASRKEGADKALVQAATGVGKTYLAAFDSKGFKRVLFVAHRVEILKQAAQSFRNVRESDDFGFFNSDEKCTDKAVIFASVQTLGRKEYLTERYFAQNYFDYVVVDEFHHAVTKYYQNLIEYFKPKFLLGLTATPDRMDGRNIYEICDYNVPFEISLKEAINKGALVPFHYYGIYDETNYSGLHIVKGHYDEKELTDLYAGNAYRCELIYKYYTKYRSERALGFCVSRKHAEQMAADFSKRGIPSAAVYSNAEGDYSEDRKEAILKLKNGDIRVIFSVDMFNEGLDIPDVDMVMFLRPTESPVVFLQQLGRGLRKSRGKDYLNVLDFIGNYEKAGRVQYLLYGENRRKSGARGSRDIEYPDDCLVDFDLRLIDLFKELEKRSTTIKEQIENEYFRVRDMLEHQPTRMELFRYMDDDIFDQAVIRSNINPFRDYLGFLHKVNDLTSEQEELYKGMGREFIHLLETTNMVKSYKMPILMSFYNHGKPLLSVDDSQVLSAWKEFYNTGTNWKDIGSGIKTIDEYRAITDKKHLSNAKSNPIHFLLQSGKGFFVEKDGCAIALNDSLKDVIGQPEFAHQLKDVISYRTTEYYRRRYQDNEVVPEREVYLFTKKVAKSIFVDGFAIEECNLKELYSNLGIEPLKKGQEEKITIRIADMPYKGIALKSLNIKQDAERVQIRYSKNSEIATALREVFRHSWNCVEAGLKSEEESFDVYAVADKVLMIECHPMLS